MTVFACSCLNIRIHAKGTTPKLQDVNFLHLTNNTAADTFFSASAFVVTLDLGGVTKSQKSLCKERFIDGWTITTCTCCAFEIYGQYADDHNRVLVSNTAEHDSGAISHLMESHRYSRLFKLVLPEINDNFIQNNIGIELRNSNLDTSIEQVENQVSNYLRDEQKAMEEHIRKFTEAQQSNYADLLQRVTKHKQAMVYLLLKSKENKALNQNEAAGESPLASPAAAINKESGGSNESSTSTASAFHRSETSAHSHDKIKKQNVRSLRRTMSDFYWILSDKMDAEQSKTIYLFFENKRNNCWLNASMAMIALNKTLKVISFSQDSRIKEIISTYEEAILTVNEAKSELFLAIQKARHMLQTLQDSILQFLLPIMKIKHGQPDSAVNALLCLFYENEIIRKHLNVSWLWDKLCSNCGKHSMSKSIVKPIITLSKVIHFDPICPTSTYLCSCHKEQEMKLMYNVLPFCLIFHFQNGGAGSGDELPSDFIIHGRTYYLSCILTLTDSKVPNLRHFITWIRDVSSNEWLDCNDLNMKVTSFSEKPKFELKDIYMCVYESYYFEKIEIEIEHFQEDMLEDSNEIIDLSSDSSDTPECDNPGSNNIYPPLNEMAGLFVHQNLTGDNNDKEKMECSSPQTPPRSLMSEKSAEINPIGNTSDFTSDTLNVCEENPGNNYIAPPLKEMVGLFVHQNLTGDNNDDYTNEEKMECSSPQTPPRSLMSEKSRYEINPIGNTTDYTSDILNVCEENVGRISEATSNISEYREFPEASTATLDASAQFKISNVEDSAGDHNMSEENALQIGDLQATPNINEYREFPEASTKTVDSSSARVKNKGPSGNFVSDNMSRSSADETDTDSDSSDMDEREFEEKMAEVVHTTVETTLAAFLAHVFKLP